MFRHVSARCMGSIACSFVPTVMMQRRRSFGCSFAGQRATTRLPPALPTTRVASPLRWLARLGHAPSAFRTCSVWSTIAPAQAQARLVRFGPASPIPIMPVRFRVMIRSGLAAPMAKSAATSPRSCRRLATCPSSVQASCTHARERVLGRCVGLIARWASTAHSSSTIAMPLPVVFRWLLPQVWPLVRSRAGGWTSCLRTAACKVHVPQAVYRRAMMARSTHTSSAARSRERHAWWSAPTAIPSTGIPASTHATAEASRARVCPPATRTCAPRASRRHWE
mmetsp:Transcript_4628/g.17382  ORF Transcript_4628/g.17382 Transcript_4628/m.17382 type:complete len:280 (+) Transcript_4628:6052-6891(+)